ncbi:MAG TPA: FAD-dependent monooxygenase [Actinomycetales bacterium]|nr:FAD-dependent monooxygenase [Actinomycetales bacterium]
MAPPPDGITTDEPGRCDVLVVGAGPTGLTLAAQLARFGVHCRIIDSSADRAHESRALGIQPRTLEVLRALGVADELVSRGNPNTRLYVHRRGGRVSSSPMFDIGVSDTAYPFLLFLAQSETETVLIDRLATDGIAVERQTRLDGLDDSGPDVACTVRGPDGATQVVRARYVVGCDGAHSTVRSAAGIDFVGGRYPQTFLLADLAVDGLAPDGIHVYIGPSGPLLFFPLKVPAPWRLITVQPWPTLAPPEVTDVSSVLGPVDVGTLSNLRASLTDEPLHFQNPVWSTAFHVSHRHATTYRRGRVFLAGDAAHIHSPAGAQGMNTGIQDAVNLGWKLALVIRGLGSDRLLDSYDQERRPVGAFVLRFTDRAFTVVTSNHLVPRAMRAFAAPRALPLLLRWRLGRRVAFRTVSQLGIRYRESFAVERDESTPWRRLDKLFARSGPGPGERLPDVRVVRDGEELWLHEALAEPALHLLLCGPANDWNDEIIAALRQRLNPVLHVHRLDRHPGGKTLHDPNGQAMRRLHVHTAAAFVVRPDGHIGARADGTDDLAPVNRYLTRVLRPMSSG